MLNNMKQETLEEASERFSKQYFSAEEDTSYEEQASLTSFYAGAKWQQERSYSEEEVYNLLLKHQSDYRSNVRNSSPLNWSFDIKEWFEQFKK